MSKEINFKNVENQKKNGSIFKIDDRVVCWFKGKWQLGTINEFHSRIFENEKEVFFDLLYQDRANELNIIEQKNGKVYFSWKNPLPYDLFIIIKTDEQIDNKGTLLDGYGLDCLVSEEKNYIRLASDSNRKPPRMDALPF